MRSRRGTVRAAARALLLGLCLAALGRTARADGQDELLVRLQPGTDVFLLAQDVDMEPRDGVPALGVYSLAPPPGGSVLDGASALLLDPRVVSVAPNQPVASPEMCATQIHFAYDAGPDAAGYVNQDAYGQLGLGNVYSVTTGAGVVVAVLDTGVASAHPALQGHLLPGYNAIDPTAAPDDVPDGMMNAAVGHGTMVAGLIARLAPGAQVMPVRVLNGDGLGTTMDVIKGLDYAVRNGARVINTSFGAAQMSDALDAALDGAWAAGVVIVASAGNDGLKMRRYPAGDSEVVAVAAVEPDYTKSPYSNYGKHIRLVAPGTGIRSTYWDGGYATWSGTSFAAPFISAAAALVRSARPTLNAGDVVERLTKSARSVEPQNPQYDDLLGKGVVSFGKAVGEDGD